MASVGFMQVGPRGICFAHGPYLNQCPQWPTCGEAPKQQRYIDLGKRLSSEWFEFPFNSVIRAEHERLKQAVVEAAQKWNELVGIPSTALELAGCALAEAVDQLNKYEAEMNLNSDDGHEEG